MVRVEEIATPIERPRRAEYLRRIDISWNVHGVTFILGMMSVYSVTVVEIGLGDLFPALARLSARQISNCAPPSPLGADLAYGLRDLQTRLQNATSTSAWPTQPLSSTSASV